MKYKLSRTDDLRTVRRLHRKLFPNDEYDLEGQLWVCRDSNKNPVGFCAARLLEDMETVFLNRSGVLPIANGNGLQRRMIKVRERWAAEGGAKNIVTYALHDNHASIVNLVKSGYLLYHPAWRWASEGVHYFLKELRS